MIEKLQEAFIKYSDRVAYKNDKKILTYKELYELSLKYSKLLKKQGSSPVIIYGHKEKEFIISIISCIFSKRAYIPIEFGTNSNRIKEIQSITNSNLVLSNYEIDGINITNIESLTKYSNKEEIINNNDIIYIIFTSGSTGEPKGVPIHNNNLINFVDWISNNKYFSNYQNINILNNASYSFDLSVMDIYYSLCNGHTINSYNFDINKEYEKIFEIYSNEKINISVMTPTFLKMCLLNNDFNYKNYSELKCIFLCGEVLDINLAKKLFNSFPNIKLINAYGPTEATCAVTCIEIIKEMLNDEVLPIGEISNSAVDITIEDDEIVLNGKSVTNGYLNYDSDNFSLINNNYSYRTGDLGYILNNKLYFIGRRDNQIKYNGYRIELEEIENQLNRVDGIDKCIVTTIIDKNKKVKSIKAYITINKDINLLYIKQILTEFLPSYMIPKTITVVDQFPLNKNGKIDRKELLNYDKY